MGRGGCRIKQKKKEAGWGSAGCLESLLFLGGLPGFKVGLHPLTQTPSGTLMVLWDPLQSVEIGGGLSGDRHDLAMGCFQKHGSKSRCSGSTSRSLQLLPSSAGGEGGSVGFLELLHGLEPAPVSLHPPAPLLGPVTSRCWFLTQPRLFPGLCSSSC